MKNSLLKKKFSCVLILSAGCLALFFSACSKGKDSPTGKAHTVVFKAFTSQGASIYAAVYGVDDAITTETSLSGISWTSEEIIIPSGAEAVAVDVLATGDTEAANMVVQIFVDGTLKKEARATGIELEALASYTF